MLSQGYFSDVKCTFTGLELNCKGAVTVVGKQNIADWESFKQALVKMQPFNKKEQVK